MFFGGRIFRAISFWQPGGNTRRPKIERAREFFRISASSSGWSRDFLGFYQKSRVAFAGGDSDVAGPGSPVFFSWARTNVRGQIRKHASEGGYQKSWRPMGPGRHLGWAAGAAA